MLVNPVAGARQALAVGRLAVAGLRRAGVQADLLAAADAAGAARSAGEAVAAGVDAVLVCGGDGMVHLALQALAGSAVTLGVLPCGTGNDFARSVGIPLRSLPAALEVVLAGVRRTVDLGRAGDRWFGAVLASGFDSKVNDRSNRMRWPSGRLRYDLAMVAELASFRPLRYRIGLDREQLELDAMLVAVGNGPSYGGGMQICPGASQADGLLDVTVISRMSRSTLVRLFPSVYSGRHVQHRQVLTFRSSRVEIDADDVTAYADGEPVGALPLTCRAVPAALQVFAPVSNPTAGPQ